MKILKIVKRKIKNFWMYIQELYSCKFIKRKQTIYQNIYPQEGRKLLSKSIPNVISLNHICGPIALHIVFPNIPESKILDAFYHCCNEWPNGGVTNKEFNIVIKYLGIKNLKYFNKRTTIGLLLRQKKELVIALVYGHYLAISYGQILEFYDISWKNNLKEKVYCYWQVVYVGL